MDDGDELLKLQYPSMLCDASLECNRTLSFKDWMDKRITSQVGVPSRKVQSSAASQTQTAGGLLMIKDEPWQGPPGISHDEHLSPAARDWIGPSNKVQTHPPPNELPFSSGVPSPTPTTKTASPYQIQGLKLVPKAIIPTRPRSFLKRKATDSKQPEKPASPSPSSTDNGSKMRKSAENLLCHLCQASCSSAFIMQQHLKGRQHRAKMRYMKMKRDTTTTTTTWGRQGGMNPKCDLCEIWCPNMDSLQMHFKGQKHKAKVQELQLCKERGGQKSSKAPIICEVCRVSCMNQDSFEQHLKGKQHGVKQDLKRRGFL